jgi:UDP-2,3-diacylglucosamine pyrophosphatase LpxH
MLVIISDLHLTDGTSGATVQPGAFQIFAERLRELAESASWRADGGYRPIEQIDLVLLGDVLDVIRSSRWAQREDVRPWGNPHAPEFIDMVARINSDILLQNSASLRVFRDLASHDAIRLPPATGRGVPAHEAEHVPVQVKIYYMVGNHDWFYHLPGPGYDAIRRGVVEHMGLAHPHDQPFPHDPIENDDLMAVMRRHRVLARHGDIYDPFNYEGDRDASSLGDAIVIELLNRFAVDVNERLGADLPESTLAGLREIDNVRPLLLAPVWIDGLLERTCAFPSLRKQVKLTWDRLADHFLDLDFIRQRDTWSPTDLVDGLQKALKFSQRMSVGWASKITSWLYSLRGPGEESYAHHAMCEQDFRNRRAAHIVYGHTHHVETVALDASFEEGHVLNQVYFNSGTWRRVHCPARLNPTEHEFVPHDVMTYLAFFAGDERSGRSYETWSGTLGLAPSRAPVYRVDPGTTAIVRTDQAHGPSLSSPGLRGHAPHFPLAPARGGVVPQRRV